MSNIVIILIAVNVIISLKGMNDYNFFEKYKFQVGRIKNGEKVRMLSSGFLHVDFAHLGFNMYALYLFGQQVTRIIGSTYFLWIYFVSLIAGNLYALHNNKDNNFYSAVGASGAVSGIIFSSILLFPQSKIGIFPIPIRIPAYIFGIGYLLYSIYGMKKNIGNVGHSAHLGGAMAGYVITLMIYPEILNITPIITCTMGGIIIGLLLFGDKIKFN